MHKLDIKNATKSDAKLLAEILTEATQYKLERGDETWGSEPYSSQEAAELIALGPTYLVYKDSKVVGTFALLWDDEKNWGKQPPIAGYLCRMAVRRGAHGQGLGQQIIAWALKEVASKDRQFLRLDCSAHNAELCTYYEKQSFVQVATKQSPRNKDYLAALYERPVDTATTRTNHGEHHHA